MVQLGLSSPNRGVLGWTLEGGVLWTLSRQARGGNVNTGLYCCTANGRALGTGEGNDKPPAQVPLRARSLCSGCCRYHRKAQLRPMRALPKNALWDFGVTLRSVAGPRYEAIPSLLSLISQTPW